MKYLKFLVGLIVVVAALRIIVGEQLSGASADAVINARLTTVRTPIAGTLELGNRQLGTSVERGEVLASVVDSLADVVRLNDLQMERRFAESAVAEANGRVAAAEDAITQMQGRIESYRADRVAELEVRLDRARERLGLLEDGNAGPDELAEAVDRTPDRLPAEPRRLDLVISHAREQVETLEIELAAARKGVFLGDGYNDAPYAEQHQLQMQFERDTRKAELADAEARLAAVTERADREKSGVNRFGFSELSAPVSGRFWEVHTADEVVLQRGDPVVTLLDCGSVMVTASVTENTYDRLNVGDAATFRMRGGSAAFEGTVTRLAGAGAATVYRALAIAPSQKHLERYDVTLKVPGLAQDPELACAVGRTGRVFFDRRPLDWLRRLGF